MDEAHMWHLNMHVDIMQEVAHSLLHKYAGLSAFSYIECINQQMHS